MKKLLFSIAMVTTMASSGVLAAPNDRTPLQGQYIIYKWYEGGTAHYAKEPPRGNQNYVMLNQYGMEVSKERPVTGANVIRPVRPATAEDGSLSAATEPAQERANVPGTISKSQRCDSARKNIEMMTTQSVVYEEDADGNLIPLADDQVNERLAKARADVSELCN